jgi:aryl-alcohol dehydrogenase-like predicted oxidoreductase
VPDWVAWEIAQANTAARLRDWSPFAAVQLRYNLLDRSPERELLTTTDPRSPVHD